MDAAWLTLAAAGNEAARHAAAVAALGVRNALNDDAWWADERGPDIYHDWIALRATAEPGAVAARLAAVFAARRRTAYVLDPWAQLDLAPFGFALDRPQPWYARQPAPLDATIPPGLDLRLVTTAGELAEFERTMAAGFGNAAPPEGALLGSGLLADPRCHFWLGRWQGKPVVTAAAVVAGGVVGIYDVATLPHARGRRFASAATCAALGAAAHLPAVLEAEPGAGNLYERLGFREFAVFRTWFRPGREVAS
jgi:ribosomal protein S18 acetylase RimI-like enzyme